jgi:uncharacterized protein with FMN-binding domain
MRRIITWFLGTVAAVALLFGYRTSTSGPLGGSSSVAAAPGVVSAGPAPDPSSSDSSGSGAAGSSAAGSGSSGAAGSGSSADMVVNGAVARTRWGPVQVQVHIAASRIVDIRVLQQPNGNRTDVEINSYALPQLRQQVLQAQSANVDGVSGATVTSDGYLQSLQSALDTAHFTG